MPASRARIPARQGAARRVAGVPITSNPFAVTAPSSLPAAAAVGIVQARRRTLRYLLLGDVTLVLDLGHGIRVLTDNRSTAPPAPSAMPRTSPSRWNCCASSTAQRPRLAGPIGQRGKP